VLINSGEFTLVDQMTVQSSLTEIGFSSVSGLVDPETAVQLGKMVGAHFVITGSITDISRGGSGGIRLGGIGVGQSSLRVTLTVRIVDVATGEILYSAVEREKAGRSQVGLDLGGLGVCSDTSISVVTAVKKLCEKIVAGFIAKIDAGIGALGEIPLTGYVVEGEGRTVYANLGKHSGIKVGSSVRILKPGKSIIDPETGEALDEELIPVAQGQAAEVRDRISKVLLTKVKEAVEAEYGCKYSPKRRRKSRNAPRRGSIPGD